MASSSRDTLTSACRFREELNFRVCSWLRRTVVIELDVTYVHRHVPFSIEISRADLENFECKSSEFSAQRSGIRALVLAYADLDPFSGRGRR